MRHFAFAVLAALCLGFAAPAMAEDAAPAAAAGDPHKNVSIAVVDVASLLRDSKAANSIEEQLKSLRKNFQSEVKADEESLRKSEKELIEQSKTLSKEDFAKKRAEFEKKLIDKQKNIQEKRAKLDKALAEALNALRNEIVKLVAKEGEKNGYDLVVSRNDIVIVSKDIDITSTILKQLNDEMPSVKVKAD